MVTVAELLALGIVVQFAPTPIVEELSRIAVEFSAGHESVRVFPLRARLMLGGDGGSVQTVTFASPFPPATAKSPTMKS